MTHPNPYALVHECTDAPNMPAPSDWMPITDQVALAVLTKLAEENAELGAIIARSIMQGLDGADPKSGKINALALIEEMADVQAMLVLTREWLDTHPVRAADRFSPTERHLPPEFHDHRVVTKYRHKRQWIERLRLLRRERLVTEMDKPIQQVRLRSPIERALAWIMGVRR